MAKTAALKKKGSASVRSRESRRAASPSIDTDKSLKNIKPPVETKTRRESVLSVHQGAGVTKKSKNGRKSVLSTKAKKRQERSMDMAEAVMDRKEKNIEKSKDRARLVQDRARAWEEQNKKLLARKAREEAARLVLQGDWVDEDEKDEGDDEEVMGDAQELAVAEIPDEVIAQSVPLPEAMDAEDDEIL